MQIDLWGEFNKLRMEHMHDRDPHNNYGCFSVEACKNCNFVYSSRACLNCANCDSCIECLQCVDCKSCAYCVGLNGASFQILNIQYTEQEYYEILGDLGVNTQVG